MSLSDAWAQDLDNVSLTYLYRIMDRLIVNNEQGIMRGLLLMSKGEHDIAWAVKNEYEDRLVKQGGTASPEHGGVF